VETAAMNIQEKLESVSPPPPANDDDVSGEESSSDDDADDDDYYKRLCLDNLKGVLTHYQCSKEQIKAFMAKVVVKVLDVCYQNSDEIRSVNCRSKIKSLVPGKEASSITLKFDYHHRIRGYGIEHFVSLTYTLVENGVSGKKQTIIKNYLMDVDYNREIDYDKESEVSIELRKFSLRKPHLVKIRDEIFGSALQADMDLLFVLLLLYASVSIPYEGKNDKEEGCDVAGLADAFAFRSGWLEHYSRVVCGCPNKDDEGYVTEDPQQTLKEELAERAANRGDSDEDEDSDY
jgi:hypothetical protein